MRKATKILTLILIVVFALSVFAGCDLIGRNIAKYRNTEAITVGTGDNAEVITVGKLLDTFNSYYNNYYYYISAGYLDASQLLDMAISSLVQQYMQLNDYVSKNQPYPQAELTDLQKTVHNADYLTKDEFAYVVKYVNYLAYNAFDQYTEDNITSKYDLEAAPSEDTSRDFTEYEELTDMTGEPATSFAQYTRDQNFVSEEADEYFEDNYPYLDVINGINLDGYLYDLGNAEQKAKAEARVKEYNDRRSDDEKDELTLEEYAQILRDTRKQYEETVENNYGISLSEFLNNQLGDMVTSCILAKWSYQYYKDIENDPALEETLKQQFAAAKEAQITDFNIQDNFDSFITSLGSSSNIYYLPEEADNYVFVKNILIPFDSYQTALLTALQNTLGSTERDAYIKARNEEAGKIVAQYFDSDKYDEEIEKLFDKDKWFEDKKEEEDDDSLWKAKTAVFTFDKETNAVGVNPDGVLGQFFADDGTVKAMSDKTAAETVIELMKRFNTDTAQHTAAYDYVVYVGDDWEDYDHSWVKEFYTAVNEDLVRGGKQYTLCVSSYGVHIIYLTGKVSESDKIFSEFDMNDILDPSTPSHNLFETYFNSQMSVATENALKELQKSKLVDADYKEYIKLSDGFKLFLKDNEFSFDFDEFITSLTEEL